MCRSFISSEVDAGYRVDDSSGIDGCSAVYDVPESAEF